MTDGCSDACCWSLVTLRLEPDFAPLATAVRYGRQMVASVSRVVLALLFLAGGIMHFARPALYDAMIPSILGWPRFWTLFTGACEVAGGIGLLVPKLRRPAGWCLIAMLLGFLWIHVQMVLDPPQLGGAPVPMWVLWLRLPLQFVLIAWIWWAACRTTRPDPPVHS